LGISIYGTVANVIRFVNDLEDQEALGVLLKDGGFTAVFAVLSVVMLIFCIKRIGRLLTDIKINKENK
jgi:hypothetical protein